MPLDGRVAIITGASRGLGADIARYLAKHGATVVLAARSVEAPLHERIPGSLKEVEASITEAGGTATSIATNMRDTESIRACVEQTAARFGRIDIVVNNAVVVVPGRLEATEDRRIELMWQVDLRGPLLLIKYALPYLKASGAGDILNISSGAARFPGRGHTRTAHAGRSASASCMARSSLGWIVRRRPLRSSCRRIASR